MKNKICCMVLAFGLLSCVAVNINLVKNGKAECGIVLAKDASPSEKLAAEELAVYIEKISGAKLPIAPEIKGAAIILGTIDSHAIPPGMKAKLINAKRDEAFYIKTEGGNIYIAGKKPIGVLYGAYTLLEDHFNVSWLLPGEKNEYIEKKNTLAVKAIDSFQDPAFSKRTLTLGGGHGPCYESVKWATRNKLQAPGSYGIEASLGPDRKDFFIPRLPEHATTSGGHLTFYLAVPPQQYQKTNPEFFALVDGQRCMNTEHHNTHHCISNQKVQDLVVEYIYKQIETYGARVTYIFGAPDSAKGWCECKNCKAFDNSASLDVSRRFHIVTQAIAKRVFEKYPDAKMSCWAYWNYRDIPAGVSIDPRMSVYFCNHGRCYAHRLDDPDCRRNADTLTLIKAWQKLNPRIYFYEYGMCTPFSYNPIEPILASDLKLYKTMNFDGWKEEMLWPDATYSGALQADPWRSVYRLSQMWAYFHVAGKLAWNPDLDLDAVLQDAYKKYYGKAYPAMQKYHALRREIWNSNSGCMGYPLGDSRTAKLLQKDSYKEQLFKLLAEAEKAAENDPLILERVKFDKACLKEFWCKKNDAYRKKQGTTLRAPTAKTPVKIDGELNDAAWASACYLSDFMTAYSEKKEALPEELKTTVGILSDDNNFYISVVAMEPSPDKVKAAAVKKDDNIWSDDSMEIFIAPPNEGNRYYQVAVNTDGVVFDAQQPGTDKSFDLGVEAACKKLQDRYVMEIKIPFKKMEGSFAGGRSCGIHFGRNRTIEDGRPKSPFSIDGEQYHQTVTYRTLTIGNPLIINGAFTEFDPKDNTKLRDWTIENGEIIKVSPTKNNVKINNGGTLHKDIWDWQGPLGQSEKPRRIQVTVRAAGPADLNIFFARYNDNKLERKYNGNENGTALKLTDKMQDHTFEYTIKPDEWVAIYLRSAGGVSIIESVSVDLNIEI